MRSVGILLTSAALVLAGAGSAPATAAPGGTVTVTKAKTTMSLTVSPVRRLGGQATVRVRGRGFDPTVGIYVALCVTPRKGRQPSPCGGGVNISGANPASAWISSNPPPYGKDLAIPFGPRGRFDVTLTVSPRIGDVDCRVTSCAIVTRADHTRPGYRRADLAVPVRFAG